MTSSFRSPSTTPSLVVGQSQSRERLPAWRLWVPLLCQTALIIAAPAQLFFTKHPDKTVFPQKTIPVAADEPARDF